MEAAFTDMLANGVSVTALGTLAVAALGYAFVKFVQKRIDRRLLYTSIVNSDRIAEGTVFTFPPPDSDGLPEFFRVTKIGLGGITLVNIEDSDEVMTMPLSFPKTNIVRYTLNPPD